VQQFWDFIPLLAFMVAYFTTDIFTATAVLMAAVTLQVGVYWATGRTIGRELKLTFWASMLFGGLTLFFRNQEFLQWKPTIVNWAMAAGLIASQFIGRANLLKRMLGAQIKAPDEVWRRLNFGWAAGFTLSGLLNLWVAYNFSLDFWVTYKVIGGFGLTLVYLALTFVYLHRCGLLQEMIDEQDPANAEKLDGLSDSSRD